MSRGKLTRAIAVKITVTFRLGTLASGRRLLATGVVTVANWVLGGFFQADLPITVALLERGT